MIIEAFYEELEKIATSFDIEPFRKAIKARHEAYTKKIAKMSDDDIINAMGFSGGSPEEKTGFFSDYRNMLLDISPIDDMDEDELFQATEALNIVGQGLWKESAPPPIKTPKANWVAPAAIAGGTGLAIGAGGMALAQPKQPKIKTASIIDSFYDELEKIAAAQKEEAIEEAFRAFSSGEISFEEYMEKRAFWGGFSSGARNVANKTKSFTGNVGKVLYPKAFMKHTVKPLQNKITKITTGLATGGGRGGQAVRDIGAKVLKPYTGANAFQMVGVPINAQIMGAATRGGFELGANAANWLRAITKGRKAGKLSRLQGLLSLDKKFRPLGVNPHPNAFKDIFTTAKNVQQNVSRTAFDQGRAGASQLGTTAVNLKNLATKASQLMG